MDYFHPTLSQDRLWVLSKMAAQKAAACCFESVETQTWSFIAKFIPNFIYRTTFINLLFMSEYGFCPIYDSQDCHENGYPHFTTGHNVGPFVGVRLF